MAQIQKIVPNLYTSGGEFVVKSKQSLGSSEEYIGSFHYNIEEDKYYTFSTPELGLESSQELVLIDPEARDEDGYIIAPYNSTKAYNLKLSRKKYEDVKDIIDTTISELAPPEIVSPELTIPERIELLKAEFSELKEFMSDPDLDLLIRESLLESSEILVRGNTDEIVLQYFDIAHFGIQMRGTLSNDGDGVPKGPHVKIEVNRTDVFEGDINHTDFRFYNFMIPIEQDETEQKISIIFDDDKSDDTGDRNLIIGLIKNKPITYHAYADNPDIFDESTLQIPEVTSSQQDPTTGDNILIPATPYDEDDIYASYEENIFFISDSESEDTKPLYRKFTPTGEPFSVPDGKVEGSEILLYDKDGDALLNKFPNDAVTYPGKFKSRLPFNGQIQIKLPTDFFLSEFPSQPVEFTTDDFQIGNIKATKIDLIECQTKEQLQVDSVEALKQRIEEENEILIDEAEAANSVSSSQAIEIAQLKSSIEMMSEQYLALYDLEDTGNNMQYNSRFTKGVDRDGNNAWRSDKRAKFWHLNAGYDDVQGGAPLLLGEWKDHSGAPANVSGYPGNPQGKIRLHYFPADAELSPEGWPNETQRIGFRMKANNYKGWPKVRLKDHNTGKTQTKTVDSYDWKIYYFDIALADVGIENKNIDLSVVFINNKMRRGPWYRRGRYNDRTGADRDLWISHIVREDGTMYATNQTNNAAMTGNIMKDDEGNDLLVESNTSNFQKHSVELCDVNGGNPYWYFSNNDYKPIQKFNNNGGLRFTFPANSEFIFVKANESTPPPNKFAHCFLGGIGLSDGGTQDTNLDKMDDLHGLFVIPYKKYKFKFCAAKRGNDKSISYNGYESDSPVSNVKFGAWVGDRRNGWRGSSNPYPGTEGYEWFTSDTFELPANKDWKAYEIEFTPIPGPQGGTKVYFGFYMHLGQRGEGNIIDFCECRIVGPLPEDEY